MLQEIKLCVFKLICLSYLLSSLILTDGPVLVFEWQQAKFLSGTLIALFRLALSWHLNILFIVWGCDSDQPLNAPFTSVEQFIVHFLSMLLFWKPFIFNI